MDRPINLNWRCLGAVALALLVAGCGGGSGSNSTELTTACATKKVAWESSTRQCEGVLKQTGPGLTARASAKRQTGTGAPLNSGSGYADFVCQDGKWSEPQASRCTGYVAVSVKLTADAGGRWYDHDSDAFTEIGANWNNIPGVDGFFLIGQLPNYVKVGSGITQYPTGGDWPQALTVYYDPEDYAGTGARDFPIVDVFMDLNPYVLGEQSLRNTAYLSDIPTGQYTGTVRISDDVPVSVALDSTVYFTFPAGNGLPDFVFSGPFVISSDGRFKLDAGGPLLRDFGNAQWDFSGRVSGLQ